MSTISSLEFWADPGYMEGSVVVPQTQTSGLTTTAPNYLNFPIDAKGINVPTGDTFSSMTIKGVFANLLSKSYLRVKFEMNNSDDLIFYGWIDSVNLKSDTDTNPVTIINWHVDLWRTYLSSATYGYGLVTSRPSSDTDPPQSLSYRYRTSGDYHSMIPSVTGSDLKWLVFTYVKEVQNATGTRIRTCAIPLNTDTPSTTYTLYPNPNASEAENCNTDSLTNVASGLFLQNYGISAAQISSAFISPVPPFEIDHIDGNKIYAKSETSGSTTEILTSTFDTARIKRVISMNLAKTSSGVRLSVSYSDGTSDTRNFLDSAILEGELKNFLDSQCGVASGGYLTAPSGFRYTVRGIMNTCFPETDWKNGDTVVLRHVAESSGTSLTRKSAINPEFEYSISHGDFQDRTYSYNNGWPDTYVYSDISVPTGQYTYSKDSLVYSVGVERSNAAYGYFYSKSQYFASYEIDLGGIKTTDTSELVVLDMTGHPVATSPWGIELGKGTVRPVISAVSAYLQYRFHDYYSATDGVEFTIPMEPVTICSNSYDDYVYSGQRDYDISQKRIASQQALVGGITSAITGGASNAIMASIGRERASLPDSKQWTNIGLALANSAQINGGIITGDTARSIYLAHSKEGAFQGAKGMNPLGAGAASIGIGVATSLVEYGLTQHYNSELQKAEDMLQAKQFDNITVSGSGWDWLWYGKDIGIVTLVADDYSLNRFNTDKRLNGIYCSEPTENCNTLISAGGPLQIIDLEVFGDIPVEARAYIKGRFANGVRILDR